MWLWCPFLVTLNEIKGNMKHVFQNTSGRDSAASPRGQLSSGQRKQGQPLCPKDRVTSPVLQQQLQVSQGAPAQSGAVGGGRSYLGGREGASGFTQVLLALFC